MKNRLPSIIKDSEDFVDVLETHSRAVYGSVQSNEKTVCAASLKDAADFLYFLPFLL